MTPGVASAPSKLEGSVVPLPPPQTREGAGRHRIAFFDYADVFEDFYPHYGVDQQAFATQWTATGNHAFVALVQREVGDVNWYETSLAPQVRSARHQVTGCLVTFVPSSWLHRVLWKAFYVPRSSWRWRGAYRVFATLASYLAPLSLALWRALRRDRPDCIFVQSYSSGKFDVLLLMARVLRIRFVAYHSGGRAEDYLGAMIRRWTLPLADRIIVSSRSEAEMLESRYRISRDRLRLILTPIDTAVFQPSDRKAACRTVGLPPERRYLLFVGRFEDGMKRVSAIIRSFTSVAADHPDADLLLVGNGQDETQLRQVAADCAPAGRIQFVGWVQAGERMAHLYNCAECLVLASRREGFPTVVGEAMACGIPVVSSNVGGVGELVEHGRTGWLFEPGDDQGLTDAMSMVLRDREVVRAMRAQVRAVAEDRVSPTGVATALRECFEW